jgi:hypothetical protein
MSIGLDVVDHPMAGTYERLYQDYRNGKDFASDLAWEIFMLCKAGEWELVERLLRALVADSRGEQLSPAALELTGR